MTGRSRIARVLRTVLFALFFAFLFGFVVGTILRNQMERPERYIGQSPERLAPSERIAQVFCESEIANERLG